MAEPISDETVKHMILVTKPYYKSVFAVLDNIMDIYKQRQGNEFNMDVTWEILMDCMEGEMELEECIRLLNGNKLAFLEHYSKLIDKAATPREAGRGNGEKIVGG